MIKNDFNHCGQYISPVLPVSLNVKLHWFGHQRTSSKSYFFDGMNRGSEKLLFWQYTISGCGMVEFGGEKYPVSPGKAFLLTIPEKHLYYLPDTPGEWEFLYLGFSGSESIRIAGELRKMMPPVDERYASAETVSLAWELIRKGMENDFVSPQDASGLTYRFLMSLVSGTNSGPAGKASDLILKIHQFCIKHLKEDISVEMLADFAGYSRSHFCRIFSTLADKSPHEYVLHLRINMAIRMLQTGSQSVKEIAAACGFAETAYFCKVFRRFTGTTPGKFKLK